MVFGELCPVVDAAGQIMVVRSLVSQRMGNTCEWAWRLFLCQEQLTALFCNAPSLVSFRIPRSVLKEDNNSVSGSTPVACDLNMDYMPLVLSQCRSISFKVSEARVMKDRCRQLGQRLSSVEEMVQALQSRASSSLTPQVGGALQRLYTTLISADGLVQKCIDNKRVNKSKYKDEFKALDRMILDSLGVLATVPHVSDTRSSAKLMHPWDNPRRPTYL
ncbi:hypothetical protein WMY93_017713 [Mugilogobius chulae]|uniref:Mixed lineage kinase domain-containing protein n=1 Tax=Mugilogobius chulae TaxID=88201 RepID=A0AAW0NW60_9GOBI